MSPVTIFTIVLSIINWSNVTCLSEISYLPCRVLSFLLSLGPISHVDFIRNDNAAVSNLGVEGHYNETGQEVTVAVTS